MHGKNCARSYVPLLGNNNSSNLTWHMARYLNRTVYYCPDNFKYNIMSDLNRIRARLVQIWTTPGLFHIRFQYIWPLPAKMYWNMIWKCPEFVPFGVNLTHFVPKGIPIGFQIAEKNANTHTDRHFRIYISRDSHLKNSRNCPICCQSDLLWPQIWSPWFGKLQMKQQSDLDAAREMTTFWTYLIENHTIVIGKKHQIHYIAMLPKSDC